MLMHGCNAMRDVAQQQLCVTDSAIAPSARMANSSSHTCVKICIISSQLLKRTLRQPGGGCPSSMTHKQKSSLLVLPSKKDVDRTCTGSLLQCPQNLLQSTHAAYYIHDDVGSAAEPDVVFSVLGVRRNELFVAAEAEWM